MEAAMQGSPKYFTYYMGQDLITQMNDGMVRASKSLNGTRPKIRIGDGSSPGHLPEAKRKVQMDLNVRLDRDRVGRELQYEAAMRGI